MLIYSRVRNLAYYMRFEEVRYFWNRAASGGRKSIRFEELNPLYFLELKQGGFLPYLDAMQIDLEMREDGA